MWAYIELYEDFYYIFFFKKIKALLEKLINNDGKYFSPTPSLFPFFEEAA